MSGQSRATGTTIIGATRFLGTILQLISLRELIQIEEGKLAGLYYFLTATTVWLAFIDLSIFEGGARQIAIALGEKNHKKVHDIWHTLVTFGYIHCAISIVIFVVVGFLVPLNGLGNSERSFNIWVASSLMYSAGFFYTGITLYFNALKDFKMIAKLGIFMIVIGSSASLLAVLFTHTLVGYILGITLGLFVSCLVGALAIRKERINLDHKPKFDRAVFTSCFEFAKRGLVGKCASAVGRTTDRLVIQNSGGAMKSADFGLGARLPEILNDALPIQRAFSADLTRADKESPEEFAKLFDHASVMSLFAALALIWIPCSAAEGLLRLYSAKAYSPVMYPILLCFGFYYALENLYASFGTAMSAIGQPQKVAPFMLYSGLFLAVFAVPFYNWFGVLGLGYLRVLVHVIQFVPIIYFVKRVAAPKIEARQWVKRLLQISFLALLIGGVNYLVSMSSLLQSHPILSLLLMIISPTIYIIICDRTKLVRIPDAIRNKLPIVNKLCP